MSPDLTTMEAILLEVREAGSAVVPFDSGEDLDEALQTWRLVASGLLVATRPARERSREFAIVELSATGRRFLEHLMDGAVRAYLERIVTEIGDHASPGLLAEMAERYATTMRSLVREAEKAPLPAEGMEPAWAEITRAISAERADRQVVLQGALSTLREEYVEKELERFPADLDERAAEELAARAARWLEVVQERVAEAGLEWTASTVQRARSLLDGQLRRDWMELNRLMRSVTPFARVERLTQELFRRQDGVRSALDDRSGPEEGRHAAS